MAVSTAPTHSDFGHCDDASTPPPSAGVVLPPPTPPPPARVPSSSNRAPFLADFEPPLRARWHAVSRTAHRNGGPIRRAGSLVAYLGEKRKLPLFPPRTDPRLTGPEFTQYHSARRDGVHLPLSDVVPRRRHQAPNLPQVTGREAVVAAKLLTEVELGKMLVFPRSTMLKLSDVCLSPLGLTVKNHAAETSTNPSDWRLIHHLSWPGRTTTSVNAATPMELAPVFSLPGLAELAAHCHSLPSSTTHVYKEDIVTAFRHIPLANAMVPFFVVCLGPLCFADLCCGFGWSASPAFFSLLSSAVMTLHRPVFSASWMYVDDGFGAEPTLTLARKAAAHLRGSIRSVAGPTLSPLTSPFSASLSRFSAFLSMCVSNSSSYLIPNAFASLTLSSNFWRTRSAGSIPMLYQV